MLQVALYVLLDTYVEQSIDNGMFSIRKKNFDVIIH